MEGGVTSCRHMTTESLGSIVMAEDRVVLTVRLEGRHADRTRFLCVVCHEPSGEYLLLGIDVSAGEDDVPALGFVFRMLWDTEVKLDGDGGFSILQNVPCGETKHFIFKPVSVQALWTVIQTLHMTKERLAPSEATAAENRYVVTSSQSCVNEWNAMADLVVRRPPSPRSSASGAKAAIRSALRSLMKTVDLDTITSKVIRSRLEADAGRSLEDFKPFIDEEILLILGQMDPASRILDHLFLGSEWNASNLDELRQNGITHVLNVTREIDNFFPGVFEYKNVRVYDEESTELLRHLDSTYRFVRGARDGGGRVLVHCKMGVSRSATVVVSYLMKEYEMELEGALVMAQERRPVVNPNKGFLKQLEVYEGILGAIRHRLTYYGRISRSKSESSLVVQDVDGGRRAAAAAKRSQSSRAAENHCRSVDVKALSVAYSRQIVDGGQRPRSWSCLKPPRTDDDGCVCFEALSRNCAEAMKMEDDGAAVFEEAKLSLRTEYDPSCECNVEVELSVPERPVLIHDADKQTDIIVQNLSNVPIQMRNAKPPIPPNRSLSSPSSTVRRRSSAAADFSRWKARSASSAARSKPLDESLLLSTSLPCGVVTCDKKQKDVLSVKTLANMYDFKTQQKPSCDRLQEDSFQLEASTRRRKKQQQSNDNSNNAMTNILTSSNVVVNESEC